MSEYDTGGRRTVAGRDRLRETVLPVLVEGVNSMISFGFDVDVYMICGFTLQPERREMIRKSLPQDVGLEVWNDAIPISYQRRKEPVNVKLVTHALSRQHRFVIKDKLLYYDVFVNFEDDMLIKGDHVQNYLEMSDEIKRLREKAPDTLPEHFTEAEAYENFYGALSKAQLGRMMPGFIRVEVAEDSSWHGSRQHDGTLEVDLQMDKIRVDADPCCQWTNAKQERPTSDAIFLWESHVTELAIHKMPRESILDWIILQPGVDQHRLKAERMIGEYWPGREGDFGEQQERQYPTKGRYASNMGGWMATREQIWQWNSNNCRNIIIPPFQSLHADGIDNSVEYWSGGANLVGPNSCRLQRIVSMTPERFSRQLLFHTANNKQKQLGQDKFYNVDTFLGQLNKARKNAERRIKQ